MILPDSVDAQIAAGIAFAFERGSFQQADRCGVVRNARRFEAMQPERGEAIWYQRAHRCGHIAFTYKWGTDPISNTAGLGPASPNIGQRQPPDHCVIVAAKNQKRVREITALIFGISFEPATKGAAREIVWRPGRLPWSEEGSARLTQRCPFGEVTAVRGSQCDARAGNARHRIV